MTPISGGGNGPSRLLLPFLRFHFPFPRRGGGWGRRWLDLQQSLLHKQWMNPLLEPYPPLSLFDLTGNNPHHVADARVVHESDFDGWRISDDGVMGGYSTCQATLIEPKTATTTVSSMSQLQQQSSIINNQTTTTKKTTPTIQEQSSNEEKTNSLSSSSASSSSSSSTPSSSTSSIHSTQDHAAHNHDADGIVLESSSSSSLHQQQKQPQQSQELTPSSFSTTLQQQPQQEEEESASSSSSSSSSLPLSISYLHWTGNIDTTIGLESTFDRAGFATLKSPTIAFGGINLNEHYEALEITCRCDARIYTVHITIGDSILPHDMFRGYISNAGLLPMNNNSSNNFHQGNNKKNKKKKRINKRTIYTYHHTTKNMNDMSTKSVPMRGQEQSQRTVVPTKNIPTWDLPATTTTTTTSSTSSASSPWSSSSWLSSSSSSSSTLDNINDKNIVVEEEISHQQIIQQQDEYNEIKNDEQQEQQQDDDNDDNDDDESSTNYHYPLGIVDIPVEERAFETLYLPFSEFGSGARRLEGRIVIESIGFTLMDGQSGNFCFDLACIRAVNFGPNHIGVWEQGGGGGQQQQEETTMTTTTSENSSTLTETLTETTTTTRTIIDPLNPFGDDKVSAELPRSKRRKDRPRMLDDD